MHELRASAANALSEVVARTLLAEAGGDLDHLVKITTFLTDMRQYAGVCALLPVRVLFPT